MTAAATTMIDIAVNVYLRMLAGRFAANQNSEALPRKSTTWATVPEMSQA